MGNQELVMAMSSGTWALKDTEIARKLKSDIAARKRTYKKRISADRTAAESARPLGAADQRGLMSVLDGS